MVANNTTVQAAIEGDINWDEALGEVVSLDLPAKPEPPPPPPVPAEIYIPRGGPLGVAESVYADPQGAAAIVDLAGHLGLDPIELTALFVLETANTLNPNVTGGDKWYGGRYYPEGAYKGLIQFNPYWASRFGTGGQQSIAQQIPAIKKYLLENGFRPGEHDIRHAYSAILAGEADQRYWGRQDSNGTSVWNIHHSFRSGPRHERAKNFLQDSGVF